MKRQQMEFTFKAASGRIATFWMGLGADEHNTPEDIEFIWQKLRTGAVDYAVAVARATGMKIVHMRGPFDVPEEAK